MKSGYESRFDPSNEDLVLDELGEAFPAALIHAVDYARDRYAAFAASGLGLAPLFTPRTVANVLHDLLWYSLAQDLHGVEGITLVDGHPLRMIVRRCGDREYRIRMKRHRERDMISSYPTKTDLKFYEGKDQTFEGFEVVNLAAGYRWDQIFGEIVCPVLSYREGKANVVWTVEPSGETGVTALTPVNPVPPQIDLIDVLAEMEEIDQTGKMGS